jgi:hypothetical protein
MSYSPAEWHDFFVMVGGGAAALTGLTVVAIFFFTISGAWLLLVGISEEQEA